MSTISKEVREAASTIYDAECLLTRCTIENLIQSLLDAQKSESEKVHESEVAHWKKEYEIERHACNLAGHDAERLSAEIARLKEELAAVRVCFAEASHNAGPAFVAHAELSTLRARAESAGACIN